MPRGRPDVLVIGSGVSGLTAAIRLLDAGFRVHVVAREPAQETVSRVAAAMWLPYRAEPPARVLGWAAASLAVFHELARDPDTGVNIRPAVQIGRPADEPDWRSIEATGARPARADELPRGCTSATACALPVCEMPIHLDYLVQRLKRSGGSIEIAEIESIEQALERAPIVVNASGLGARELVGDRELFPIRGQVASVPRGNIERVLVDDRDEQHISYVVPRSRDCVLGGVAEVGREELAPDPETTRAILERCTLLEPRLAGAAVLDVRVGLRPGRSSVRLEAERRDRGLVVHDYGHGGAGVTLSWGCAAEVVALVRAHLARERKA